MTSTLKPGILVPGYVKHYQSVSTAVMMIQRKQQRLYYSATETAANLGISKQTLLRYEAKGIFPKPTRNQVNGWREYTQTDIRKLRKIIGR